MTHLQERSLMLKNRLKKKERSLRKWASQNDLECYRLYDRDIPEIPLVIDRYKDHAYVAHRVKKSAEVQSLDEQTQNAYAESVAEALQIQREHVVFRVREKKSGSAQYEKINNKRQRFIVREQGLSFWVNLWDYLDTGLFLDHRVLRQRVRQESKGKRVLNLFAYTGSFGVYALNGGAAHVEQVDLSKTYSAWGVQNALLNAPHKGTHSFRSLTVDDYLEDAARGPDRFDLVVVDPPTFSTSKSMRGTFDVQRDHGALLLAVHKILAPKGVVYFSCNARSFKLSEPGPFRVEALKSVPRDFANRHAHRAFKLTLAP